MSVRSASDESMSLLKVEMVVLEINFGKGRKDDILVHFGDNPRDLAEKFVAKHSLKRSAVPAICATLEQTIADFRNENDHSKYFEAPMNTSTTSSDMNIFANEEGAKKLNGLDMPEIYKGQPPVELQINGLPVPPRTDIIDDDIRIINGYTVEFPAVDFTQPTRYGSLISFDSNTSDNLSNSQPTDETRASYIDTDTDTGSRKTSYTDMNPDDKCTRNLSASTLGTSSICAAFNILEDDEQQNLLFDLNDFKSSPIPSLSFHPPVNSDSSSSYRPISGSSRSFGGSISGKIAAAKLHHKSQDKITITSTGLWTKIPEIETEKEFDCKNADENESECNKNNALIKEFEYNKKIRESFLYEDIYEDSEIVIINNNYINRGLNNSLSFRGTIDEIPFSSSSESCKSSSYMSPAISSRDCPEVLIKNTGIINHKTIVPKLKLDTTLNSNLIPIPSSLPFSYSGTNSTYNSGYPSPGSIGLKTPVSDRFSNSSGKSVRDDKDDLIHFNDNNIDIDNNGIDSNNIDYNHIYNHKDIINNVKNDYNNVDYSKKKNIIISNDTNNININNNDNNNNSSNDNNNNIGNNSKYNIIVSNDDVDSDHDNDSALDSNSTTPISAAQQQKLAALLITNELKRKQKEEISEEEGEKEGNNQYDMASLENLKKPGTHDSQKASDKEEKVPQNLEEIKKNIENNTKKYAKKEENNNNNDNQQNVDKKYIFEPCSPDDSLFRYIPTEQSFKSNSIFCDFQLSADAIDSQIFSFSKNTSLDNESPGIEDPGSGMTGYGSGISSNKSGSGSYSPIMRGGGKKSVIEMMMKKEMEDREKIEGELKFNGIQIPYFPPNTISNGLMEREEENIIGYDGDMKISLQMGSEKDAERNNDRDEEMKNKNWMWNREKEKEKERERVTELEREEEREKEREKLQNSNNLLRNSTNTKEEDSSEEERTFLALKLRNGQNQGLVPSASMLALTKEFRPESQVTGGYTYSNKLIPKDRKSVGDRLHDSALKLRIKREKSITQSEEKKHQLRLSSQFVVKGLSKKMVINKSNIDVCNRLYIEGLKLIEKKRKRARDKGSEWTCTRCGVSQLHSTSNIYTIQENDHDNDNYNNNNDNRNGNYDEDRDRDRNMISDDLDETEYPTDVRTSARTCSSSITSNHSQHQHLHQLPHHFQDIPSSSSLSLSSYIQDYICSNCGYIPNDRSNSTSSSSHILHHPSKNSTDNINNNNNNNNNDNNENLLKNSSHHNYYSINKPTIFDFLYLNKKHEKVMNKAKELNKKNIALEFTFKPCISEGSNLILQKKIDQIRERELYPDFLSEIIDDNSFSPDRYQRNNKGTFLRNNDGTFLRDSDGTFLTERSLDNNDNCNSTNDNRYNYNQFDRSNNNNNNKNGFRGTDRNYRGRERERILNNGDNFQMNGRQRGRSMIGQLNNNCHSSFAPPTVSKLIPKRASSAPNVRNLAHYFTIPASER